MDASQQRLGEIGRGFGAEPPRHEGADRFVALIAPRRDEQLRTHPSLPGPREHARPDERTPFGRNPEHGGRRQCVKTTITLNEREPWQLRRHQLIAEAKLFAELDPLRLLNEQGVWSTIDREAVDLFTQNHATEARTAFEQDERHVVATELIRRCKTGNAAADDDDLGHRSHGVIIAFRGPAIRGPK